MRYLDMLVAYVGKKPKWPTSQTWMQNFSILVNVYSPEDSVTLRIRNRIYLRHSR